MKAWIVALAAALWFGCGSSPTRFYVLNPMDPGRSLETHSDRKAAPSVEIASLQLPQYLERPQIVTRPSESRLEVEEFHQWGGNLRKDMMRVLSKNLSQLLATPHVSMRPHVPKGSSGYCVEVEVMKFERDPDGKVRLSARWALSLGRDRKPLTTRITDLESPVILPGPDMEPTVSAMSRLWGELSQEIARFIWKNAQGDPLP